VLERLNLRLFGGQERRLWSISLKIPIAHRSARFMEGILRIVGLAIASCALAGLLAAQVKVEAGLGVSDCRQVDVPGTPPFLWSVDPAIANKDSLNVAFQADEFNGPEFRTLRGNPPELYFAAVPRPGLVKRIGPYSKENMRSAFAVRDQFAKSGNRSGVPRNPWPTLGNNSSLTIKSRTTTTRTSSTKAKSF
jgi:hypothetical protein